MAPANRRRADSQLSEIHSLRNKHLRGFIIVRCEPSELWLECSVSPGLANDPKDLLLGIITTPGNSEHVPHR